MGKSDLYRIRVKSGRNFIDVQGDKKFAEKIFSDISEIFTKAGKKPAPKKRGRPPKSKPPADVKIKSDVNNVPGKDEKKPNPKKRGRKPKPKPSEDVKKPSDAKNVSVKERKKPIPKKRGRKPNPKPAIDLKTSSVDQIISLMKGKRSSVRVLVSGFILNKKLGKHEFKAKDMISFMEEYQIEVPQNPTYHFRNLKESGSFLPGRKNGRFKISDEGIKQIEKLV